MATIEELQAQIAALSARVDALTVPPNRYYSSRYTGETIDKLLTSISGGAANLDLSNLTDYQRALANLGGRPNRNLWDNGYFIGGGSQSGYGNLPINQKGKQLYDQADGNCIDRHYKSSDAVVELLGDCLKVTLKSNNAPNRFAHKFFTVFTSGITYTVSVLVKSVSNEVNVFVQESGGELVTPVTGTISGTGVFSATFTCTKTAMYQVIFSNESRIDTELELMACGMHASDIQLLAYSESDRWNLFETPDYGDTLARCQRYLIVETAENEKPGSVYSSTSGVFTISTAVQMRTTPVLAELKGYEPKIALSDGSTVLITKEEITVLGADVSGVRVRVDVTGGKTLKLGPASIRDCNMVLSAEL